MSGLFFFDPEAFYPDVGGVVPHIAIELVDMKHPGDTLRIQLEPRLVARLWNDFAPLFPHNGEVLFAIEALDPDDAIRRRYAISALELKVLIAELGYTTHRQAAVGTDSRWHLRSSDSDRLIEVFVEDRRGGGVDVTVANDVHGNLGVQLVEALDAELQPSAHH